MSPHFADLRTITHGAESYAKGFDPMIDNPEEPWQRKLNYPRIWQGLYSIGINHTHTTYMGIGIIFSFLIGVCLFLPNASNTIMAVVFVALISPATLLGVERCNIDLLMFFLVSVAVVGGRRSNIISSLAIFISFTLKLFPIFAWILLLRAGKSRFLLYTLVMLAFVGLYTFATYSDILWIRQVTPKSIYMSYGMNAFWMGLSIYNETLGAYMHVLSYLLILLIFVLAFSAFFRNDHMPGQKNEIVYFNAFRAGSAIYVGTFLLGNNWDYRLVFLMFTIPQLILWTKHSTTSVSSISKVTISAILISLWHLEISRALLYLPYGFHIDFILDEMFNWIAFSGLVYLLIWSLPTWAKVFTQKQHPLTRLST